MHRYSSKTTTKPMMYHFLNVPPPAATEGLLPSHAVRVREIQPRGVGWRLMPPLGPTGPAAWIALKKSTRRLFHPSKDRPIPEAARQALHAALKATRTHSANASDAWRDAIRVMQDDVKHLIMYMNAVSNGKLTAIEEVVAQGDEKTLSLLAQRLPSGFYGRKHVAIEQGKWIAEHHQHQIQGRGLICRFYDIAYLGQLSRGMPQGDGCLQWGYESSYRGHFKEGLPNGHGVYVGRGQGNSWQLEGVWQPSGQNLQVGFVRPRKIPLSDGKTVRGIFDLSDGSRYEGPFVGASATGSGSYRTAGGSTYDGMYKNGRYDGEGTLTLASCDAAPVQGAHATLVATKGTFRGAWCGGVLRDGQGDCVLSDGATYIGAIRDGHLQGGAQIVWPNGVRYEGQLSKDDLHGEGTITWQDQSRTHGIFLGDDRWQAGKRIGGCYVAHGDGTGVRFFYDSQGQPDARTGIHLAGNVGALRSETFAPAP